MCGALPAPPAVPRNPSMSELEDILRDEEVMPIEILPNGEIRALGKGPVQKPLTMRENLGGEYAA